MLENFVAALKVAWKGPAEVVEMDVSTAVLMAAY